MLTIIVIIGIWSLLGLVINGILDPSIVTTATITQAVMLIILLGPIIWVLLAIKLYTD